MRHGSSKSRPPDARWCGALGLLMAVTATVGAAPETYPTTFSDGQPLVRLSDLARLYGLRVSSAGDDRFVLASPYHTMVFEMAQRRMSLMNVWLQHPVTRVRGRWAVHRMDADHLLDPILRSYRYLASRGATVVVLDPGHGGRDGGAESPVTGQAEKDLALDIARRVRDRLPRDRIVVRLTRENDEYLDLEARSRLAARWGADVLVSIHLNSGPDPSAQGIETYILSKPGAPSTNTKYPPAQGTYPHLPGNAHDAASAVLGFALQKRMQLETGAVDRGLRHARFVVLKDAPCAAALVECGFRSNAEEARRLAEPDYRDRLANGIARGILEYYAAVQKARLMQP